MKISVVLFTYNRSRHTEEVINALKKNTVLPEKLYIFQDGLKAEDNICEWEKVNALIRAIDWCETEVLVSDRNKGLAESIVSGINYVFNDYDALVVLEDDCVPTANFISYMYQCFDKYKDNKTVYSLSGYSWPIEVKQCKYDVYSCGRSSSYGWGTWKDRWKIYKKDYEIVRRMKADAVLSQNLAMWGQDLEDMVVGNVKGYCDSWAVFWSLGIIEKRGICINPYQSFIKNIGMDGSGVHCGITDQFDVECVDETKEYFCLPDEVEILDETQRAFAPFHGSYTALNVCRGNRERAVVYGVGNFFLRNEKQVNEEYFIELFADRNKKGYYAGKRIVNPKEIENFSFEKLVIMVQNPDESMNIAQVMKKYGISEEKIEFGFLKYT